MTAEPEQDVSMRGGGLGCDWWVHLLSLSLYPHHASRTFLDDADIGFIKQSRRYRVLRMLPCLLLDESSPNPSPTCLAWIEGEGAEDIPTSMAGDVIFVIML